MENTETLLHTTGYAQVMSYLDAKITRDALEPAIVTATWQLSRKQMTWFRRNTDITWIHTIDQANSKITQYLEL